jgi:hypothetical protein
MEGRKRYNEILSGEVCRRRKERVGLLETGVRAREKASWPGCGMGSWS